MIGPLILGIACFFIFLLINILIFHFNRIKRRSKTLLIIFFFVSVLYCIFYILLVLPVCYTILTSFIFFINGFVLYAFLFICYLEFYFTADRSITVRIMIELEKSKDMKMTYEEIKKIYDIETDIFKRRFIELEFGNYIKKRNKFYENTLKGHIIAKIYDFYIKFLNLSGG